MDGQKQDGMKVEIITTKRDQIHLIMAVRILCMEKICPYLGMVMIGEDQVVRLGLQLKLY